MKRLKSRPTWPAVLSDRQERRLAAKRGSTPGSAKGLVPNGMVKCLARRGRSYKDPMYDWWSQKYRGDKVRKGAA